MKRRSHRESGVWSGFSRFQVPTSIVREGVLFGGTEATILLVLFKLANTSTPRDPVVTVRVSLKRLTDLAGLADRTVRRALKSLEANKLLEVSSSRKMNGRLFGCNTYRLLHPETGECLRTELGYGVCYANEVQYFTVPTDVVKHHIIARLELSEKSLYIALLIIAGRNQVLTFTATTKLLTKLSDLSVKTFRKATEGLEIAGLVVRDGKLYTMCDPLTRERSRRYPKAEDDPKNWTMEGKKALDYDALTALQWKQVIDVCFKGPYIYAEQGWTAATKCPYHSDTKPTLSFNFERGCFKCHSKKCTAKGKLSRLVKHVMNISEQETQAFIAQSAGLELKFNRPTKGAIKTWTYLKDEYTLMKEVFLFADGEIIEKPNGKKFLYHLPEVRSSQTVLVLQNEDDCDRLDKMGLKGPDGRPVATTTGGYGTGWLPKFASDLQGKNVVIIHVSDADGLQFYTDVANSLDERSILHRRISVKEWAIVSVQQIEERIGKDWLYEQPDDAEWAYSQI